MVSKSVLLDTNFLIHLLQEHSNLHQNTKEYFKYFCEQNITMKVSTISIAEYCVKGNYDELPLRNLQIVPFNINHAIKAGKLAQYVFGQRSKDQIEIERKIIANDTKLFAQADVEQSIEFYISSDCESKKIYDSLSENYMIDFRFIDLHDDHLTVFGKLF